MINLDRDVVDGFKRWITNISIISKSRSADTIINREGANRSWYTESYASMIQRRHFRIDQKRDYYVERRVILDRRSIPSIESHPHSRHNSSPTIRLGDRHQPLVHMYDTYRFNLYTTTCYFYNKSL